jgi:hypothetical protein
MSIDLRGFTYYPDSWGEPERWESKFSEYYVIYNSGLYRISKNVDEFWSFGDDPTVYMNLEHALNTVRSKAINKFFGDEY